MPLFYLLEELDGLPDQVPLTINRLMRSSRASVRPLGPSSYHLFRQAVPRSIEFDECLNSALFVVFSEHF